jgi:predicted HTH domain antitoxin
VALYRRGVLPLGKARVLAQLTRWEFEELLGRRGVTRQFGAEDLDEDLRYARSDR